MGRMRPWSSILVLAALLEAVLPASPARGDEGDVVAAFEDGADLTRIRADGATLALGQRDDGVDPRGCLLATSGADVATIASSALAVTLTLPPLDLTRRGALSLSLRARRPERAPSSDPDGPTSEDRPTRVTLRALDASGDVLFVRRLPRQPRHAWTEVVEPLAAWRWGEERAGDWSRVRALEVGADGCATLELDDVRFVGAAASERDAYAALAFPGEVPWARETGPFLLLGAPAIPEDDGLERTAARLAPLAAWLDRVAGDAVAPIHDGPVIVLLLADRAAFDGFLERLGVRWRAHIAGPASSGYALQDVCAVAHDPSKGLDRPVVVHEALHALIARRLRLLPGNPRHSWLQEGLANYLQLALHPSSLETRTWRHFARGTSGFFRPLREVLVGRTEMRSYAQLASVVAFLLAERPTWLPALARDLAAGSTTAEALARLDSSFDALEADWLAWGRATLASPEPPPDGRHFPLPPEWSR